jgi:hypothetical protein
MTDPGPAVTETVRQFDFMTGEWRTVTVTVPAQPSRPARDNRARKPGQVPRRGAPRDLAGLSDEAPIPPWWRDTAFSEAEGGPLADMRRHVKADTMKTHRPPTVAFAAPGTGEGTRWFDL